MPQSAIPQTIILGTLTLIAAWICIPPRHLKDSRHSHLVAMERRRCHAPVALLYWICDLKGRSKWAILVKPAGSNALLTYLLPDLWYFLFASAGVTYLDTHFSSGWPQLSRHSSSRSLCWHCVPAYKSESSPATMTCKLLCGHSLPHVFPVSRRMRSSRHSPVST